MQYQSLVKMLTKSHLLQSFVYCHQNLQRLISFRYTSMIHFTLQLFLRLGPADLLRAFWYWVFCLPLRNHRYSRVPPWWITLHRDWIESITCSIFGAFLPISPTLVFSWWNYTLIFFSHPSMWCLRLLLSCVISCFYFSWLCRTPSPSQWNTCRRPRWHRDISNIIISIPITSLVHLPLIKQTNKGCEEKESYRRLLRTSEIAQGTGSPRFGDVDWQST